MTQDSGKGGDGVDIARVDRTGARTRLFIMDLPCIEFGANAIFFDPEAMASNINSALRAHIAAGFVRKEDVADVFRRDLSDADTDDPENCEGCVLMQDWPCPKHQAQVEKALRKRLERLRRVAGEMAAALKKDHPTPDATCKGCDALAKFDAWAKQDTEGR